MGLGLEKPNLGLGETFFPNSVSDLGSAETFQISRNVGLVIDENVCLLNSQPCATVTVSAATNNSAAATVSAATTFNAAASNQKCFPAKISAKVQYLWPARLVVRIYHARIT